MTKRNIVIVIFFSIVIVFVAYYSGSFIGKIIHNQKQVKRNEMIDKSILPLMKNISIGDAIPDFLFENLSFESVNLKSLLKYKKTMLIFIDPDCHTCIDDIELLKRNIHSAENSARFIFISSGNPRLLIDIKNKYNIISVILYDHQDSFSSILGIISYPFHITVDENMKVLDIIPSPLTEDKIKNVIN